MISSNVKLVEGSERVKVRRIDSPILSEVGVGDIATLGALVSMEIVAMLEGTFGFPAASVNFPPATEIVVFVSILSVGVKVAK